MKGSLEPGESVVEALIVAGHTTEEVVLGLLAKEFSLPLIDLAELESRQICREPFDRKFLIDKGIILFNRTSTECKAAIFDPLKMDQFDDLSSSLSLDLQAFLCSKSSLLNAFDKFSLRRPSRLNPFIVKFLNPTIFIPPPKQTLSMPVLRMGQSSNMSI